MTGPSLLTDHTISPVPGAADRIAQLRSRYSQLTANIAHYEERVASQASQLNNMSQTSDYDDYPNQQDMAREHDHHSRFHPAPYVAPTRMDVEDVHVEEEEIRALERKKRALEERVTGMEKDIGGLMR